MSSPTVSFPRDENTPTTHLPYSPCVVVNGGELVFISGQASTDHTGQIIPDTFEGEFRRSIERLKTMLKVAGCELKDVIQTRNYVRDETDLSLYNELYKEYFHEPRPTRTTITNCLPSTIRYEIECVAVRPQA